MTKRSHRVHLANIACFTAIVVIAYCVVIPHFFSGYRTSWIILDGASVAALLSGYAAYRNGNGDGRLPSIPRALITGLVVGLLVYLLSFSIVFLTLGA